MTTTPKFKGPGIGQEMIATLSDKVNGPSPWHFHWWGPGSAIFIVGNRMMSRADYFDKFTIDTPRAFRAAVREFCKEADEGGTT